MAEQKTTKKDVTEFLATARKRFARLHTEDHHNREAARSNLKFTYEIEEGQWPEKIKAERESEDRPCLTSGKLRKFVASVANSERDQRIAGNVIPVDDEGDVLTANIIAGHIRQIEHASDAQKIYTNAGEQAIAGNVGYWRIKSEELDDSFEQELFLEGIKNQFAVYLDPDGMFGFIEEKISKDEFEFKYPDATKESIDTSLDNYNLWYNNEDIIIREYFYKKRVKTTIVQVRKQDDSGQLAGEVKTFDLGRNNVTKKELETQGWVIEKEKTPMKFMVKWAKITATQILEEGEWPGKDIPIVEVEGDWVWLDGKLYKRGLIEGAKDDQRQYNFWKTSLTERYALSVKAPYLVTVKMVEGLGKFWDFAHKKLFPYLPYNFDKKHGGAPKRELPPQISTGETSILEICNRDIEDTIGRFKASFGQASNERTGVAIRERANRSELSTFHFPDNFRRAILKSTRILIDVLPFFLDTQRTIRIRGENNEAESVVINYEFTDEVSGKMVKLNDLSLGKYDVVEGVKLMSTRRQEQLQGMQALAAGNPQLGVLLAGDIAKALDWEGAQQIADKIDAVLPALLGIKPQDAETQPES